MIKPLKKYLIYLLHSKSIFRQLLIFTSIVGLMPLLIISYMFNNKINSEIADELFVNYVSMSEQYASSIEYRLNLHSNGLVKMSNNTMIQNSLYHSGNPYKRGRKCSAEVQKMLTFGNYQEIKNCIVYSLTDNNPIYGTSVSTMEAVKGEKWASVMENIQGKHFRDVSAQDGRILFSLIEDITFVDTDNFQEQNLGFVKMDLYADKFFEPVLSNENMEPTYDIIVLDENSRQIYISDSKVEHFLNENIPHNETMGKADFYKDTVICSQLLETYGLKIVFLFDIKELSEKQQDSRWTIIPLVFIMAVLIILLSYFFSKQFSNRVQRLVYKMHVAETGDLQITEIIEGNDEITTLDIHFNHMIDKLNLLIHKNYIQELERKETILRNLQLQINPHFLYNTLETISSLAAVKHVFEICELTERLGDIFRYSLGKKWGEYVQVEQELHHTNNYIYIQKTRFPDKFKDYYNIEKGCEKRLIPRFILQPLVENAIVHGAKDLSRCMALDILVYEKDNILYIKVEDDGVGMTDGERERLNSYINDKDVSKDEKKSIGIRNVHQRIQLLCGEEYGIVITAELGKGSCFMIKIPCIESKGERGDEV